MTLELDVAQLKQGIDVKPGELAELKLKRFTLPEPAAPAAATDPAAPAAADKSPVPETKKLHVLEVSDALFRTDSAVLLPEGQDPTKVKNKKLLAPSTGPGVLATALRFLDEHRTDKVLVAGHTDTVGTDEYNLTLSELRALCVQAALTGDRDGFAAVSDKRHKTKDYQQILTWISVTKGFPCDPGGIDGDHGKHTSDAVKAFKKSFNEKNSSKPPLEETGPKAGQVDLATWGAFFDCYEDALVDELGEPPATLRGQLVFLGGPVGCGEFHPIEKVGKNNFESQTNRRVEILFFAPGQEPDLGCHAGKCQPKLCQVYEPKVFDREHIPPLLTAKKWRARWDKPEVKGAEKADMILDAPDLPDGSPVAIQLFQDGAAIEGLRLDLISDKNGLRVSFDAFFDAKRCDISRGKDFKFTFEAKAGGRDVLSTEITYHPAQFKLRMTDGDTLAPKPGTADRDYRLEVDDQKLKGKSDGNGVLLQNVSGKATDAKLFFGVDPADDTKPALWTVNVSLLAELPAPETPSGARIRLNNLGFCAQESPDGPLDAVTKRAIQRFQVASGLAPSGTLDADTVKILRESHGS